MSVSVVVVTYRRLRSLGRILEAWLQETPDVWLCDCSLAGFETSLPVKIVRAVPDPGNKIRHAVATMTSGDIVIKADDDILPLPGIAADFAENMKKVGPAILGIHGRTFEGPEYYGRTTLYGGKGVEESKAGPKRVDFVGVMTCSDRMFLAMDLRDCRTEVEDLYWQMEQYPQVPKYVIPTRNFMNLPESKDAGRLCGTAPSREIRAAYFRDTYAKWCKRSIGAK